MKEKPAFKRLLPIYINRYIESVIGRKRQIVGSFNELTTSYAISKNNPLTFNHGLSRLFISIESLNKKGTLFISGTKVDRNTGNKYPHTTEALIIDNSTSRYRALEKSTNAWQEFTGAYISLEQFEGDVEISTANVEATISVWSVLFEQFNNLPEVFLSSISCSMKPTTNKAKIFINTYLFDVNTASNKVDVHCVSKLDLKNPIPNRLYSLRHGTLNKRFSGTTDGLIVEVFTGPSQLKCLTDLTIKICCNIYERIN